MCAANSGREERSLAKHTFGRSMSMVQCVDETWDRRLWPLGDIRPLASMRHEVPVLPGRKFWCIDENASREEHPAQDSNERQLRMVAGEGFEPSTFGL